MKYFLAYIQHINSKSGIYKLVRAGNLAQARSVVQKKYLTDFIDSEHYEITIDETLE